VREEGREGEVGRRRKCLEIFYIALYIRHLLSLKHYDGDIEDLDLNFTVTINDFGQSKVNC
jgi:hypothetical protein